MRKAVHQLFNVVASAILFAGCVKADNILDPNPPPPPPPQKPKTVEIKKTYHDANEMMSGPNSFSSMRFALTDNTDATFKNDPIKGDWELRLPNASSFFEARDMIAPDQTPLNAVMFMGNAAHIFSFYKHVADQRTSDTLIEVYADVQNKAHVTFYEFGRDSLRFDYSEANRRLYKAQETLPNGKKPMWSLNWQ